MAHGIFYLALGVGTFLAMEAVAWLTHKYVMHGFLWCLHKSHHQPRKGFWELNDVFGLFFAAIAIGLIYWGVRANGPGWAAAVGVGVTAYGVVYFLAHDVLVHRRVALRINPKKGYLRRLYQAHRLHHAVKGKEGCVSFGFVFPPSPSKLKAQLQQLAPLREHESGKTDHGHD